MLFGAIVWFFYLCLVVSPPWGETTVKGDGRMDKQILAASTLLPIFTVIGAGVSAYATRKNRFQLKTSGVVGVSIVLVFLLIAMRPGPSRIIVGFPPLDIWVPSLIILTTLSLVMIFLVLEAFRSQTKSKQNRKL